MRRAAQLPRPCSAEVLSRWLQRVPAHGRAELGQRGSSWVYKWTAASSVKAATMRYLLEVQLTYKSVEVLPK